MSVNSIIIATPDTFSRKRLVRIVDKIPEFKVIASTADLMNTYNEVEEKLPKAVLISDVLARLPEFEVMRALFSTLDIRWLIVTTPANCNEPINNIESGLNIRSGLFAVSADAADHIISRQLLSLTLSAPSRKPTKKHSKSPKTLIPSHTHKTPSHVSAPSRGRFSLAQEPSIPEGSVSGPTYSEALRMKPTSLVLIGASTGGVDALLCVLSSFPADCPPTLIVQHTGTGFGESLVGLLGRQCRAKVQLASGSSTLRRGVVTVGAGTQQHLVIEDALNWTLGLRGSTPVSGHLPAVDAMFKSAVQLASKVNAALLTGMGRDGAEGLKSLRDAGAFTIAQDEASSVVYGMPRAAAELNAADKILPIDQIGPALLKEKNTSTQSRRELTR